MSKREPPTEASEAREEGDPRLSLVGDDARVAIPPDATPGEAAAVAVAVGAHLTDRQRAAGAAATRGERRRPADPWRLADRLGTDGPDRWLQVEAGEEWRAAGRRY